MRSHRREVFPAEGKEHASPEGADGGGFWSSSPSKGSLAGLASPRASAHIWAQLFPGALSAAAQRRVLQQWNRMALSSLATVSL